MAQFKIVNSNKSLLSYIQEKAQEEFGATPERADQRR